MNHLTSRLGQLRLYALFVSICVASVAYAQAPEYRFVTLIQFDNNAQKQPAMVYPAGTYYSHTIIGLRSDASAEDLYDALLSIDALIDTGSAGPTRRSAVGVRPTDAQPRDKSLLALSRSFLAELSKADRRDVAGFQTVRARDVRLHKRHARTDRRLLASRQSSR